MQAVDLSFEINAETDCMAGATILHNYVLVEIKERKELSAANIFKTSHFFIGDMANIPALEKDLREFITIGLDLIKQENPATYSRIKNDYNA